MTCEGLGSAEVHAEPDETAGPADRYNIVTRGLGTDDVRFSEITLDDREEVSHDAAQDMVREVCGSGLACSGCVVRGNDPSRECVEVGSFTGGEGREGCGRLHRLRRARLRGGEGRSEPHQPGATHRRCGR